MTERVVGGGAELEQVAVGIGNSVCLRDGRQSRLATTTATGDR